MSAHQSLTYTRAAAKFRRGEQRLLEAQRDTARLGSALLALHGAIEDYLRLALQAIGIHTAQEFRLFSWPKLIEHAKERLDALTKFGVDRRQYLRVVLLGILKMSLIFKALGFEVGTMRFEVGDLMAEIALLSSSQFNRPNHKQQQPKTLKKRFHHDPLLPSDGIDQLGQPISKQILGLPRNGCRNPSQQQASPPPTHIDRFVSKQRSSSQFQPLQGIGGHRTQNVGKEYLS